MEVITSAPYLFLDQLHYVYNYSLLHLIRDYLSLIIYGACSQLREILLGISFHQWPIVKPPLQNQEKFLLGSWWTECLRFLNQIGVRRFLELLVLLNQNDFLLHIFFLFLMKILRHKDLNYLTA